MPGWKVLLSAVELDASVQRARLMVRRAAKVRDPSDLNRSTAWMNGWMPQSLLETQLLLRMAPIWLGICRWRRESA